MKDKKTLKKTLKRILSFYEGYRISLRMSKEEATLKTLEAYDDFYDWLYDKGEFNTNNPTKANK